MLKLKSVVLVSILAILISPSISIADIDPIATVISKAEKQKMLSQKIAKAYFFMKKDIRADKARIQLEESLTLFVKQHDELVAQVKDKEFQELFTFIDIALPDYANLIHRPYSKKRGREVLILSETLLEVYQSIADRLIKTSKQKEAKLVKLSGHGLMLSQRMAKQYMAYHAGIHNPKSVEQFNKTVTEFETTLKTLIGSEQNTPSISSALSQVETLWSILQRLLDLDKTALPVTVFATTDKITEEMNAITRMYAQGIP